MLLMMVRMRVGHSAHILTSLVLNGESNTVDSDDKPSPKLDSGDRGDDVKHGKDMSGHVKDVTSKGILSNTARVMVLF